MKLLTEATEFFFHCKEAIVSENTQQSQTSSAGTSISFYSGIDSEKVTWLASHYFHKSSPCSGQLSPFWSALGINHTTIQQLLVKCLCFVLQGDLVTNIFSPSLQFIHTETFACSFCLKWKWKSYSCVFVDTVKWKCELFTLLCSTYWSVCEDDKLHVYWAVKLPRQTWFQDNVLQYINIV